MPCRATPLLTSPLVTVLALASCAAPAAPPALPAAPPAPATAPLADSPSPPSTAKPAAPPSAPPTPALALPPPLTEALLPLTRTFAPVPLPGVRGHITSISGRGPEDVWLLSSEEYNDNKSGFAPKKGKVVHHDGRRVIKEYKHPCWGAQFSSIEVARDGIILAGSNPFIRAPPVETALLSGKGSREWECWNAFTTSHAAPGDAAWTLNCGSQDGRLCYFQAAGGRRAAIPATHASFGEMGETAPHTITAWEIRGDDDGWMVAGDDTGRPWLLRYNGVTWVPKAALDGLEIARLWVSSDNQVWLLAPRENQPSVVLRFDGRALHAVPVPESFKVDGMLGVGREMWFYGRGRKVYQHDGQRLRQGEASFEVSSAWAASNGQVWIAGGTGNPDDESGKPMAARTAPFTEGR